MHIALNAPVSHATSRPTTYHVIFESKESTDNSSAVMFRKQCGSGINLS